MLEQINAAYFAEIQAETAEQEQTAPRAPLASGKRARYALAGNAILTVRNPNTGNRFTYKITRTEPSEQYPNPVHFVGVLTGTDNTSNYSYIGIITQAGQFRTTAKTRLPIGSPSINAFSWLARNWEAETIEVWHEGKCGRCGRVLTVPESIETGLGPTCAGKD